MTDEDLKKFGSLLDKKLTATEQRLVGIINSEISSSEKRVLDQIGDFVNDQLLPEIGRKADKADLERLADKMDIERIERKLDHFSLKVTEHDKRLGDIESIPVVAHELRRKK